MIELWRWVMIGVERIYGGPRSATMAGAGIAALSTPPHRPQPAVDRRSKADS